MDDSIRPIMLTGILIILSTLKLYPIEREEIFIPLSNRENPEIYLQNDTLRLNDTIQAPAIADDQVKGTDEPDVTQTGMEETHESEIDGDAEEPDAMEQEADKTDEDDEDKPSYWAKGGQTALNFSQISLSNWFAGGQNSASFSSYLNLFLNHKTPDEKLSWENTLDLGYGLINQEHRKTVKSDDKIDFSSKLGIRASDIWSYTALLNFRTQFAPGFKSPGDTLKISNFMAPAYIGISIGMDHKFDDNITFYFSPLAGKITMVYDDDLSQSGSFGVKPGENLKYEFGGFIRAHFRATLMENISITSRLELFSNYLDKPKNFDVNFDSRINMHINRYVSANLVIQMLYDENTRIRLADGTTLGPRLQIKQVFGLGLTYRF